MKTGIKPGSCYFLSDKVNFISIKCQVGNNYDILINQK